MASASIDTTRGWRNEQNRYGRVSQTFHWLVAALIVTGFALGLSLENFPRDGATYTSVILIHKSIGLTILALAILRLSWILRSPAPEAAAGLATWERRTAWVVHKLLYFLMFAIPLSGIVLSQAVGKEVSFLGWFSLPQFIPVDPAVPVTQRPWVIAGGVLHTLVFKVTLIATVLLHVAGALKHALIDRDPAMFRRMWGR